MKLNEIFGKKVHNAVTKNFSENYVELVTPHQKEIKEVISEALIYFSNNYQPHNINKQRLFWNSYEDLVRKDQNLKNFIKFLEHIFQKTNK